MVSFPPVSPPRPYTPLSSPIRATCPAQLILLDFITRTILDEEYRSFSSSLCNLLHSPVTSSLLGLNILLNTIYYQYIPLLNLCLIIFGLTLFNWPGCITLNTTRYIIPCWNIIFYIHHIFMSAHFSCPLSVSFHRRSVRSSLFITLTTGIVLNNTLNTAISSDFCEADCRLASKRLISLLRHPETHYCSHDGDTGHSSLQADARPRAHNLISLAVL